MLAPVTAIEIFNFRSHRRTVLNLDRFNLILGPAGAGKSSIIDALCYAFTGACRGTDESGRGSAALQALGEKGKFSILVRRGEWSFRRMAGQTHKSACQTNIDALGVRRDALMAVLQTGRFLSLSPQEQRELYVALGAPENIRNIVAPILEGRVGRVPESVPELNDLEESTRESRRALKAELTAIDAPFPAQDDGRYGALTQAQAAEELRGTNEAYIKASAEYGTLTAPKPAAQAPEGIAKLERELAAFETAAGPFSCPNCETALTMHLGKILKRSALDAQREVLEKRLAVAKKEASLPEDAHPVKHLARTTELKALMEALSTQRRRLEARLAWFDVIDSRAKKREGVEAAIRQADALIEDLGPKGKVRAALAGAATGPDLAATISAVHEMGGWGRVKIQTDPWEISVNGIPAALLSSTETWRLELAIKAGISKAAGIGLLVIDGSEIADAETRSGMTGAVIDAAQAGFVSQAIIIGSRSLRDINRTPIFGFTLHVVSKPDGTSVVESIRGGS